MGGNLFHTLTQKLTRKEFERVKVDFTYFLNQLSNYHIIQPYRFKDTFGDIDIITSHHLDKVQELVFQEFGENILCSLRENTFSFLYENKYQVDIITTRPELFESTVNYYKYGDLGMLLGLMAHGLNLKYGTKGLLYTVKHQHYREDIFLTSEIDKILSLLGFHSPEIEQFKYVGFDTQEDIFKWIYKSKLFHPSFFEISNKNQKVRTRAKKRKMFNLFIQQISGLDYEPLNFIELKQSYLIELFHAFPFLEPQIKYLENKFLQHKKYTEKFNGNVVMKLIPIVGKELGNFMHQFKTYYIEQGYKFKEFVINIEPQVLSNLIIDFYSKHYLNS